jgi:hypothetical protein
MTPLHLLLLLTPVSGQLKNYVCKKTTPCGRWGGYVPEVATTLSCSQEYKTTNAQTTKNVGWPPPLDTMGVGVDLDAQSLE